MLEQLLAHFTGDYVMQSHWMAEKKKTNFSVACLHGAMYTLPFLFITQNALSISLIATSHIVIDYFNVGHFVMWAKDQLAPKKYRSSYKNFLGSFPQEPKHVTFWLRVIIDNIIHIAINYAVLTNLG